MRFFFFLSFLFSCLHLSAQDLTLSGSVKQQDGAPVVAATVSLLKAEDSSWVQSVWTDEAGAYRFALPAEKYIIVAQALGYDQTMLPISLVADMQAPDMVLAAQSQAMDEVVVSGKKRYIENQQGKTVVNVEGSISAAGSNAYDLLKRAPGVQIDMQGNISLEGKQGVLVLINDRPTYLSGKALEAFLKSLSSDNIAKLELITQPSAKYDAAGNAGIINIQQKKQEKKGLNGNISSSLVQGVYLYTPHNVSLNYNTGKLNLYTTAGYFHSTSYLNIRNAREMLDGHGNILSRMTDDYRLKETLSDLSLKLGADYTLNEKATAGLMVNGIYHPNKETDQSISYIRFAPGGAGWTNKAITEQGFIRRRFLANGYLKYKLPGEQDLQVNADYLAHTSSNHQYVHNSHYDISPGLFPDDRHVRNQMPHSIHALNLKADHTWEPAEGLKLETGLKAALVKVEVDADFDVYENGWRYDSTRSNHFIYQENINAAYVAAHKDFGEHWKFQAGLRAEQANIAGRQLVGNQRFVRSGISLFPTLYVTHVLNEKHQLDFNYGRRIQRPAYKSLNPFANYDQQYFYQTGNPGLMPTFTHNLELKHNYDHFITTKLHGSCSTGTVDWIHRPDSVAGVTYSRPENLGSVTMAGMSLQLYKKLVERLELTFSANSTYSVSSGRLNGVDQSVAAWRHSFNLDTSLALKKGWAAEAHANYTPSARASLTTTWGRWVYYNVAVSKTIWNDSATIKLNIADPTHSTRTWMANENQYVRNHTKYEWNTRQVTLAFSYRFGGKDKHEQKRSTLDEAQRM